MFIKNFCKPLSYSNIFNLRKTLSCYTLVQSRFCSVQTKNEVNLNHFNIQKYLQKANDEYTALEKLDSINRSDIKRKKILWNIVAINDERKQLLEGIESLKCMKNEKEGKEMLDLIAEESKELAKELEQTDDELIEAILAAQEGDDFNSLVLEVTAGVGGQEAMLFARELFDMYCAYCVFKGWESEIVQMEQSDLGGLRHASIIVTGDDAFRYMKYEGGVHRVQRIPATEKSGRIHTSTVSVAIIPSPDDCEIEIKDKDLKIETKRASGAGGQHVNTTDSAVRIIHIPTGIAVECQTDRSQFKNRELAMKKLQAKLYEKHLETTISAQNTARKSQVGSSLRNEKIRTYNFNQDRITDHRIEEGTTHNLKSFLEGGAVLDDFIVKLVDATREKNLLEIIYSN